LAVDSTFEFERRRHEPVKYDRELMGTTLKAIKRVTEIKQAREARFWENRMKDNKKKEKAKALDDLKTGIDLIRAPLARAKDEALKQTVAVKAKTTVSNNDAAAAGSSSSAMEE
jgi:large subunit ribosomal protein L24e